MSSLRKIEANRRNAQASTGPRTPEGRAAVSGNATTHGLRAAKSRLYFEPHECQRICRELTEEWQPATPTECNLVDQMAIAQAKLVRLERNLTHAFYQSEFMKMIGCEGNYTEPDGRVRTPNAITNHEFQVQKLINGISQSTSPASSVPGTRRSTRCKSSRIAAAKMRGRGRAPESRKKKTNKGTRGVIRLAPRGWSPAHMRVAVSKDSRKNLPVPCV